MPKGSYSDKEKERAYAMYAAGISGREIARQLDIPEATIRLWFQQARAARSAQKKKTAQKKDSAQSCADKITAADEPENVVDLDEMRTQKKIEFINSAWQLIGKSICLADKRVTRALEHETALDLVIDEIEDGDLTEPAKRALISKVRELQIQNVRELSTLIGTMYDKAALASGDPTMKADVSEGLTEADKELLHSVNERLAADSG